MVWYILLGTFALLGLVCALWGLVSGWFCNDRGSVIVYLCQESGMEYAQLQRYRWLRGMGFLHCPLLMVDSMLPLREQQLICSNYPGVEFCTLAELPARLELERTTWRK